MDKEEQFTTQLFNNQITIMETLISISRCEVNSQAQSDLEERIQETNDLLQFYKQ